VKKGDLLVQLDKEPYQIQVKLKRAAVVNAEADLKASKAVVRGILAQARSQRWKLQQAIEDVDNKVATLRARVATLRSKQATLDRAKADLARAVYLSGKGAVVGYEFDQYREAERVADAAVAQSLEEVYETRVALGLPPRPEKGELTDVPADLNQTYSGVREALASLVQSGALVGYHLVSDSSTPRQALEEFARGDEEGNIDRILERLVPEAPAVLQAQTKLLTARHDLEQAELNLRYCDVVSEIDGVVTSRNINPGNNVAMGQALMAVRSVSEIWIDANFKETQLADLRIGQRVRCEFDMYGGRREFEGRISGFTMGTGQTLALLPPQNATGNYVKIVQRLPVRIDLTGYDPDKAPLFVGLSVTPYVYYKERPAGPHAGDVLRPHSPLPLGPAVSGPGGGSQAAGPVPDGRDGL
jgi:membrane fusion protein (multidrug efflux system)